MLAHSSASADARSADFEALVGPWVEEMYRAAAAIVGPGDAADVTQEALLDAWRGFARLRDRTRVRPWLHAIVANRASKQIRASRSRPRLIAVEIQGAVDASGSRRDIASAVVERDRMDRAFARLTADQRICLAFRYSIDLSVPQIATALGIPDGTVKSRIHAGVERLRATLAEDDR
jgi:RNA polymerase sigma-70 factor (ECF subfamily)